jgi:hypothetical protein
LQSELRRLQGKQLVPVHEEEQAVSPARQLMAVHLEGAATAEITVRGLRSVALEVWEAANKALETGRMKYKGSKHFAQVRGAASAPLPRSLLRALLYSRLHSRFCPRLRTLLRPLP